jgi:hypothetical protein
MVPVLATNPVRTRRDLSHPSSSDTPVVVMEATEYGDCKDAPLCRERSWSWNRQLVTEGLVRTRFVVKADVLGDDAPEVILTKDEDVVEQFSPERTGEAFSEGIHVRRAYRRAHEAATQVQEEEYERLAEPHVERLHEVTRPRHLVSQERRPALPVASGRERCMYR